MQKQNKVFADVYASWINSMNNLLDANTNQEMVDAYKRLANDTTFLQLASLPVLKQFVHKLDKLVKEV